MVHCFCAYAKPCLYSLVNTATLPSLLAETWEERPFPESEARGENQPLVPEGPGKGDTVGPGLEVEKGSGNLDIGSSITEVP